MQIIHELNQLDFGGVERVIRNIMKFDKENEHTIIAYKDGPYGDELRKYAKNVIVLGSEDEIEYDADLIHIHTGGEVSHMARSVKGVFPVVETIHSPVRSPMFNDEVTHRVGVCDEVSRINHNCETIKNGLDFEDMIPGQSVESLKSDLGIPDGVPVVGRLGRIGRDKGLEDWILTCYYMQQAGHRFVPVIIGDEARNADGYRGKLKLMCESLPLNGVVWIGNQSDVASYMQLIDVFLYPSPTEGFGLVIAEAMAFGAVVCTYKNPVNMELFGGYAAMSDPDRGVGGLVDQMSMLLSNPDYCSAFTGSPRDFILSEYQAERMSLEYQEIYERSYRHFNVDNQFETADVVSA